MILKVTLLAVPVGNVLDARRRWSSDYCHQLQGFYLNEWKVLCLNDQPVSCCNHAPKI